MEKANQTPFVPKPEWLKVRAPEGENYARLKNMMTDLKLATVCQSARCPNIGECWSAGTATVMLMGDVCTRGCRFCNVKTGNPRGKIDAEEPQKVGYAIGQMNLDYVVLTSVDRDDLPDQGAEHFAKTIRVIKETNPKTLVEILTPDFRGDFDLVKTLVAASPDVFAHNIETVERLTKNVRDPRAGYQQSLAVLRMVKDVNPEMKTKSSIMLGLGEEASEVEATLRDLRAVGCDVVTFGQYLQPTSRHLKVVRYLTPDEFDRWKEISESMGFLYVASGPMVRSSYRAGEFFMKAMLEKARLKTQNSALPFQIEHWGLINYQDAMNRQLSYAQEIRSTSRPSTLVFCTHNPIVTLGRRSLASDVTTWSGPIETVNRGGRATYHGPSQIVGYPLFDLNIFGLNIHAHLRSIESAIVGALATIGISAQGRQTENSEATGVWVGSQKIASIGIGVRNWVSLHGFALNVDHDDAAFQGIKPCGFSADTMTSIETVLGRRVERSVVEAALENSFRLRFLQTAAATRSTDPHIKA